MIETATDGTGKVSPHGGDVAQVVSETSVGNSKFLFIYFLEIVLIFLQRFCSFCSDM